jgi:hypothetical protein
VGARTVVWSRLYSASSSSACRRATVVFTQGSESKFIELAG